MQQQVRDAIQHLGQPQLLIGIEQLSLAELQSFLAQLQKYDLDLAVKQKKLMLLPQKKPYEDLPFCTSEKSGNFEDRLRGEALIREGKVGCLILAGGQGTRLGCDGPKGAVAVTPHTKKSLFQLFCERTQTVSFLAGRKLPLCLMTSGCNHAQTVAFFEEHNFFRLDLSQISFFKQGMLPFLDDSGKWFLEKPGKIAEGPDGNGHALQLFFEQGIWKKWKEAGIEYLNVIFVDNALADPFDAEFVGLTARTGVDAALKAVERLSPDEKMGALVQREGKLKVIEYSELPPDSSAFPLSSTGMFCISMDFIAYLCREAKAEFPLHLARKKAEALFGTVDTWKCERFLFDLLDYARSSATLVCPRDKIYAPLKNATGDKSLETVQKALLTQGSS